MTIVIGEISYTNVLPFFYYIDREKLKQNGCNFLHKVPSTLNQGMAAGNVDVGTISSFAYAENATKYTLLPNLSVSANKAVGSIFLFSKKPIEQLNGASIALTSTSATSVNLLKIILEHFYEYSLRYETMEPSYAKMMAGHDACLLIGDDAIVNSWKKDNGCYCYDLGELWYNHTGLSMTFAVFAVRNETIEKEPETLQMLYKEFIDSKMKSIEDEFQPMIADIRKNIGGSNQFWNEYFQGLCFDLEKEQLKGLQYYYQLAYEHGILKHKVNTIAIWNDVFHLTQGGNL